MNKSREDLLRALVERVGAVMRGMHPNEGFQFAGSAVRPPHVRILFYLAARPEGVCVKDLAEILGVTPGAVTQFIDALVEKGLVERKEDSGDRRLLRMKLTEYAKENFNKFRIDYFRMVSHVFDSLSDGEIIQLTTLLRKANIPFNTKELNK